MSTTSSTDTMTITNVTDPNNPVQVTQAPITQVTAGALYDHVDGYYGAPGTFSFACPSLAPGVYTVTADIYDDTGISYGQATETFTVFGININTDPIGAPLQIGDDGHSGSSPGRVIYYSNNQDPNVYREGWVPMQVDTSYLGMCGGQWTVSLSESGNNVVLADNYMGPPSQTGFTSQALGMGANGGGFWVRGVNSGGAATLTATLTLTYGSPAVTVSATQAGELKRGRS